MFNLTNLTPQLLADSLIPVQYFLIALTVAVFVLLFVLIIHIASGKRAIEDLGTTIRDLLGTSPLTPAVASVHTAAVPDDMSEDELVAVMMAAISAYEADTKATTSDTIAAGALSSSASNEPYPEQAAPTNLAGFKIRSIKRVS